jgi:hypothetical protein
LSAYAMKKMTPVASNINTIVTTIARISPPGPPFRPPPPPLLLEKTQDVAVPPLPVDRLAPGAGPLSLWSHSRRRFPRPVPPRFPPKQQARPRFPATSRRPPLPPCVRLL